MKIGELRYEIKFVASIDHWDQIVAMIRLHPSGLCQLHPPRLINNLYFDSHDLRTFNDNAAGISRREKVRYRWYGDSRLPVAGALETKRRRGTLSWKESYPVDAPSFELSDSLDGLRSKLRDSLNPAGQFWLDSHPQAVLVNRYRREYFISLSKTIRVTLDRDLVVYDQRHGTTLNASRPSLIPDLAIIEIKTSRAHFQEAQQVAQGLPLRLSRCSKYCIAVGNFV